MEADTPRGCLLLAEMAPRRALELVYLGLTLPGRGRGIGRALLQQTLLVAHQRRCELLTVAVDEGNTPALKLYRRFGYSAVSRRMAMVKQLQPQAESEKLKAL
jgi:ribosomal protein S18 acetylase RimI-like enzyme